jgi:hypothetical protein
MNSKKMLKIVLILMIVLLSVATISFADYEPKTFKK